MEAVSDGDGAPGVWETWGDMQKISLPLDGDQSFDGQAVHPARGTGVPSPAAASDVRRDSVDVRRDDVVVPEKVTVRRGIVRD